MFYRDIVRVYVFEFFERLHSAFFISVGLGQIGDCDKDICV